MKKIVMFIFMLATLIALPTLAKADFKDRLFDFTDDFYRQNGVDPAKIIGRRQGVAPLATLDTPMFVWQRNVRALLTLPAYNHSGNPVYWTVMGELNADGFTNDAAGRSARRLADASIEYVFPTQTGNPIGLGNLRQSVMLDMRNGYLSNNPLGLWIHVWISYTPKAFNTSDGKKELADLKKKNGLALDGTPIIASLSEIDKLYKKGFIAKRLRKMDGSEGAVYSICPVIKDPTDGGISPDQFLAYTRKADGTPLEPFFVDNFNSLKTTWRWAD